MKTPRLATSIILRASRSSIPRTTRSLRTLPKSTPTFKAVLTQSSQLRFYSQPADTPSKHYSFSEIQTLTKSPSPKTILIDTREPSELQSTGTIPGSLNIPITSKPDSFFISAEEFEDRFGFERPGKETDVVFYCKAGVRSRAAAALAKQAGWLKVGEYSGSWLDWEKNGGEKEPVK